MGSYEKLVDKADQRQSLAAPRSLSSNDMFNYNKLIDLAVQTQSLAALRSSSPSIISRYKRLIDKADQRQSLAPPRSSTPSTVVGSRESRDETEQRQPVEDGTAYDSDIMISDSPRGKVTILPELEHLEFHTFEDSPTSKITHFQLSALFSAT
ncbi:MAG: hypothetical protein MMC33_001726 [Icmadophila ericetorum]|nr:hypothetical protein [Icmadophila ericetorum]